MEEIRNEEWEDWEDENMPLKCLLCKTMFDGSDDLWRHCIQDHNLDFFGMMEKWNLNFYQRVQLVNFVRQTILDADITSVISALQEQGPGAFDDSKYLRPVLQDDAVLYSLETDEDDEEALEEVQEPDSEEETVVLKQQLSRYATIISQLAKDSVPELATSAKTEPDNDTYYFDSYSAVDIHREMIQDQVRTDAYRDAIQKNRHLFENKIVLDVGCGTGILSLFAAQAGAARVIGVDCSEMLHVARQIVDDNNLSDKITLIKGKIEEIELPVDHVDVIVSEWMGYCLLYESMLDSVLYARDTWLKKDGHIFPDKSTMFVEAVSDGRQRRTFWNNVYGFDMRAVANRVSMNEGFVETISADCVLSDRAELEKIDIDTVKYEELNFSSDFQLQVEKDGSFDGLAVTFDVDFERDCTTPICLSTAVQTPVTHWKHIFFGFEDPVEVKAGQNIHGSFALRRNATNQRNLNVDITVTLEGKQICTQSYLVE